MLDRRLDDLADGAPSPGSNLADRVIVSARRRERRRWAVLGAGVTAAAVAVAVPIAVAVTRSPPSGGGPGPSAAGHDSASLASTLSPSASPPGSGSSPQQAGVMIIALRRSIASESNRTPDRRIEVRASFCDDIRNPTTPACAAPFVIPPALQSAVLAGLADPRVVFVPPTGGPAFGSGHRPLLTLSKPRISGDTARIFVQTWRGFNDVRGEGFVLTLTRGRWRVTGSDGGYIS